MCKPKDEYIEVCEVIKKTKPNENDDRSEGCKMYIKTKREGKSLEIQSDFSVNYPSNDIISAEAYRLKYHIYHEVQSLRTNNNVLLSTYAGNSPENSDIENLLFYNIGTGAFSKVFQSSKEMKQVAFKMDSTSQENQSSHKYKYEVVCSKNVEKDNLCGKTLIAKWNGITIGRTLPQKPDEYYAALRSVTVRKTNDSRDKPHENEVIRYGSEQCETFFGIKIELIVPDSKKSIHPVSVMKHLLDGVICAFHGEEGEETKKSVQKRFQKNGLNKDEIKKFFDKNSEQLNLFGNRNYLTKSSRWNPEDDRLQFGWIVVKCEGKAYKMSGEIYNWD